MLVTGHGSEALRSAVETCVRELHLEFSVYDREGYPVDPTVHAHEACIRAIHQHDIVLAFLDASAGSRFQLDSVTPETVTKLRELRVLPSAPSARPTPTITQVEILTARALDKPTLVFVTSTVMESVEQTMEHIRDGALLLQPLTHDPPDYRGLLASGDLESLLEHYEIPSGRIESADQMLFVEYLRRVAPNYLSIFDPRDLEELCEKISGRLQGVVSVLIHQHSKEAERLIRRARSPLVTQSLRDLLEMRLILEPPYQVESGDIGKGEALYDLQGRDPKVLASALLRGRNVLLLGDPGHGKSTAALLCFRELVAASASGVHGYAPLFAKLRAVLALREKGETVSSEDFLRALLALPSGHRPWPSTLRLPERQWILVLDGADEASLDGGTLTSLLGNLTTHSSFLLTCRSTVFDRKFSPGRRHFDEIVRLLPWSREYVETFVGALQAAGKQRAAHLIDMHKSQLPMSSFISIPLWLSMLAYLAERRGAEQQPIVSTDAVRQYELLRICSVAVAEDEVERQGLDRELAENLLRSWRKIAWLVLEARSEGRVLWVDQLPLGERGQGMAFAEAVLSVLDIIGKEVLGFFHEIFFEFWLADYIVDVLIDDAASTGEVASVMSLQRSYVTNQFVRQRIASREDSNLIGARLRGAYHAAESLGQRKAFACNQILYLLGRIDKSTENRDFVRAVWRSDEPEFVKYAAAFSAVILGDEEVEDEYFRRLSTNPVADRINRGYHLSYYGDTDPLYSAEAVPEDQGESNAARTLSRLFERLQRTESRHKALRRIELFTIRRFLETDRRIPDEIAEPMEILYRVESELHERPDSSFRNDSLQEVRRIRDLMRADDLPMAPA